MNITIRNLQEAIFRKFKAKAANEGMKLGDALTQAMEAWTSRGSAKPRGRLSDIKPFDWGKGTERTSSEVDKILYG